MSNLWCPSEISLRNCTKNHNLSSAINKKLDEALKIKKQIKMTIPDGTVIGILF